MMEAPSRIFAIVPAAGVSRRMGRHKLLLPFRESTVIWRLLAVLDRPEIAETFVVIREQDSKLRAEIRRSHAHIVSGPTDPADMRGSVLRAFDEIRRRFSPRKEDGWLLVPADHPLLDSRVLDALLQEWQRSACRILVPAHKGRRGHPTLFRWELTEDVAQIPADAGINRLLAGHAHEVTEIAVASPAVLADLDTPEEYEKLLDQTESE